MMLCTFKIMIHWTYIPFSITLLISAILLVKIFKEDDASTAIFDLIALVFFLLISVLWGIFFIW